MPAEPEPVTVSQVVHRAVEVCESSTSDSLDELQHRRDDEVAEDRIELLRLAARAEFAAHPPPHIEAWLSEQGVSL